MATDIREPLALQTATSHVEQFAKQYEYARREQFEGKDVYQCEAFLQLGIDAFRWLLRADYGMRQAFYSDVADYDSKLESVLMQLFREWLSPAEFAEQWAKAQSERGFAVSNFPQFRECCEEVRAILDSFDDHDSNAMSEQLATLRDQAIYEQQHGETAEFF